MPRFLTEPAYQHGSPAKTAVLLVNLGTPESATAKALRPYLKQFLSDPRVVEIPRPIWWLILNGIILNTRPAKSAKKYATIWTPDGSPLKVHTEKQAKLLKGLLGERGQKPLVAWAMRYGQPGIGETLSRLKAEGATRILIVPLYPQYAASTTGSVMDEVGHWLQQTRNQPEIRSIRNFHDDAAYLAALEQMMRTHWQVNGMPDESTRLVMSFHGLPKFHLEKGDPYHCECLKTGRLLAERLNLGPKQFHVTFQSRFGRAEWLQPYTAPTLHALAKEGVKRVDVICPGFTADCLETLEEIAQEAKADFLNAGGKTFHYIPALNEHPLWITALGDLVQRHLQGWPMEVAGDAQTALRAKGLGANNA